MVVIILSTAPARLRGALTRWLLEVSTGVYVGRLSARVRDQLWELIENEIGRGQAILVHSAHNEQHLNIESIGHEWAPGEFEGLQVMMKVHLKSGREARIPGSNNPASDGWSIAARRRKFGNTSERMLGWE